MTTAKIVDLFTSDFFPPKNRVELLVTDDEGKYTALTLTTICDTIPEAFKKDARVYIGKNGKYSSLAVSLVSDETQPPLMIGFSLIGCSGKSCEVAFTERKNSYAQFKSIARQLVDDKKSIYKTA